VQTIAPPDSKRALADDLVAFVGYLQRTTAGDFLAILGELDMPLSHFRALMILEGAGELPLKGLTSALGLSLAAASRAVDALHRTGFVTRTEDPDDRRSKRIALTEEGSRLVDRLTAAKAAGMAAFVDSLSARERGLLERAITPILTRPDAARCRS
jgi:DNA-binding MarR family transcriptional regulator